MIRCLFREPKFPVICDVQGVLTGARTPGQFVEQVSGMALPAGEQLPLVDACGEGWVLHTDHMIISPFTFKRRWTKKEIIAMFNNSDAARRLGERYSTKSLSSKRLDRIVAEIVALIARANQRTDTGQ